MNILKELESKLDDQRHKLERLEDEKVEIENKIEELKNEIEKIRIRIESEALPTKLYLDGYKLREKDNVFYLLNSNDDEITYWNYSPSLGDLFDAEKELVVS